MTPALSFDPISTSVLDTSSNSTSGNERPASTNGPVVLGVSPWAGQRWLLHGFSTRVGGMSRLRGQENPPADLNLGYTANDLPEAVSANRQRLLSGIAPDSAGRCGLVTLKQMHSAVVRVAGREDATERPTLWGDGLMTDEPGVLLGVQTADCFPILIADTRRRAVAAFHAGWRGTLKGIVERGVGSMRKEFGSQPEDLTAAIGPGIGNCCFTVGPEVEALFAAKIFLRSRAFRGKRGAALESRRGQSAAAFIGGTCAA
jgi:YfiH family protein